MGVRKVLMIDPDPELGGLLKERLSGFDIDVLVEQHGMDGFDLAKQVRPHVIIQELALPDVSGFYLLEKIRTTESTFSIPIVVMTHRTKPEIEERAMNGGANIFIRKPYNVKTFIPMIEKLAWQGVLDKEQAMKAWSQIKPAASYRLVTERLEVEIRTDHYMMRGLSSGINENGMGAHMNVMEKNSDDAPPLGPQQPCTVYFRSIKYPLLPCRGTVLRLEESWDRRYRQFIAIQFAAEEEGGMIDSDRLSLREWIRSQMK